MFFYDLHIITEISLTYSFNLCNKLIERREKTHDSVRSELQRFHSVILIKHLQTNLQLLPVLEFTGIVSVSCGIVDIFSWHFRWNPLV